MSAHDDETITPRDDAPFEVLVPTFTADGHLDDGTIEAWLDSAFDDVHMTAATVHVEACASCRARVAEARGFMAGASRVVHALDMVPAGVVPAADVARTASRIVAAAAGADATRTTGVPVRARRAWYTQPVMRAAAAVLVMVVGGTYVWSRTSASLPTTLPEISAAVAADSAAPVAQAARAAGAAANADQVGKETATARAPASAPASAPATAQVSARAHTDATTKPDVPSVSALVVERAPASMVTPTSPVPSPPPNALRDRPTPDVAMGKVTAEANFSGKAAAASDPPERRADAQRAVAFSGAGRLERADAAANSCWAVSATDSGPGVVLPTHIGAAAFVISSRSAATWSNWPTRGQVTPGEFTLDSLAVLRGAVARDDLQLTLSLTARDDNWVGTATQRRSGTMTIRGVVLTRANPVVCKP